MQKVLAMTKSACWTVAALGLVCVSGGADVLTAAATPLEPFPPDEQTLLLYHFDEGQGAVAKDASRYGYDGEVLGAQWTEGRFGKALHFDGVDDCVFRKVTSAIEGLKQITVECWFKQENPEGRQFLLGKDVTFHFDFSAGMGTSLSLYHRGGTEANVDGLRHQQLGLGLGSVRPGRWHHLAATFDGQRVSFFLDGALRGRQAGARDFLLGVDSRGIWVGCYVGDDFWFSGKIDEVRVSNCLRYDPEGTLQVGQKAVEFPPPPQRQRAVRTPQTTGKTQLRLTLKKLDGPNAAGWVSLKSPRASAVIVGGFDLANVADQGESQLAWDVSDELAGDGSYIVGLEETGGGGYFAVTAATLAAGDRTLARWSGQAASRRTFAPPVLVPLQVHGEQQGNSDQDSRSQSPSSAPASTPGRILLLPQSVDRWSGDLEFGRETPDDPPSLFGEGLAEYWLEVPRQQAYRVYLRYAAPVARPCDFVIDGTDLHPFHMAARNRTGGATPRQAFWEYQGTVNLAPGPHWIRLEGVLPEIVALRLEPVAACERPQVAWQRFPVPEGDFLMQNAESWDPEILFGTPMQASMASSPSGGQRELRFSATFANNDPRHLFAGDAVRLWHRGQWDLEPFGRLRFRFQGVASGHVVSLWAVDLKGDEKLLWRQRDSRAEPQEILVPISFEGNDVFDPGHVTALCLELDEGNERAEQANHFSVALIEPLFERRDVIQPPEGYAAALAQAHQTLAATKKDDSPQPDRLTAPRFQPWTKPVVPEEHPRYAQSDPKPVTRATLGYELHCTGARSIDPTTLDQFHKHYDFGDVCWPHIGICPQRRDYAKDEDYRAALARMEQQLEEVCRRGLYVFDIWGYVPFDNNYPARIAPEHREILSRVMGDRFLGFDNGEQDGRYIGGYAAGGKHTNRREGWEDFVRWDEQICRDSQNYIVPVHGRPVARRSPGTQSAG
nr:LamG domain-containing protein [Pirellulaceae bacterium]